MRRLLAGLAGAATIVALWAAPADAHAELESTEPVGGTVLDDAPARVMLRFSEAVDVSADSVRVYDSDADRLRTGRPRHPEGRSAEVTVELPELRRGAYVVTWRAVSVDSHPVHGAFTFRVGDAPAGDAQALLERLVAADGGSTTVGVVYGLVRFAAFAALAALVGGTAFCVALWPAGLHHRTARRLIGASLLAAVATTAAVIVLQGVYSAALPLGDVFRWSVIEVVLETRFGLAWLVRLVLLVAAGPLLVVLFRGVRQGRSWPVIGLVVVGAVVLVTPGLGGHAGATHPAALHVAADAVHLGAACFWLGGLVLLVLALLRQPDDGDVTVVVPRFSRAAFVAVLVILATGAFQAWRQAGSVDAVTGTTYGRLVLTKVGLLAAIVVLAALSRSWVRRRALAPAVALGPGAMAASQPSLHQLRRSVGGEVAIAVAVLAVTALLVNTVPARSALAQPFSAELHSASLLIDVTIDPAKAGPVDIHTYTLTHTGAMTDVEELTASLTLTGRDVGPIDIPLRRAGPGHFAAYGFDVPIPGVWQLEVTARTSDIDQETTGTPVRIR